MNKERIWKIRVAYSNVPILFHVIMAQTQHNYRLSICTVNENDLSCSKYLFNTN
jgi:hypothetical protein